MEIIIVLFLALTIDLALGEFPHSLHPVVWLGNIISIELRLAPGSGRRRQLTYGIAMVTLTIAVFALTTYFLLAYLRGINTIAYILLAALLLKSSFSVKELRHAALKIKTSLESNNIIQARLESRALVSRDTSQLDEPHLVSATLESIAENTSDSLIAPLLYFLILGVPGAIAYRVVNTFDAMVGYHGEYEHLGKFAARLDDWLNFIPARLSGLLLVLTAYLQHQDGRNAWRIMMRDHKQTESPNAGWPMSALAGALRTSLEKDGHYKLGDANRPLSTELISRGLRLVMISTLLWAGFCLTVEVIRFVVTA